MSPKDVRGRLIARALDLLRATGTEVPRRLRITVECCGSRLVIDVDDSAANTGAEAGRNGSGGGSQAPADLPFLAQGQRPDGWGDFSDLERRIIEALSRRGGQWTKADDLADELGESSNGDLKATIRNLCDRSGGQMESAQGRGVRLNALPPKKPEG